MARQLLFILSWFIAGGLTFYSLALHRQNASLVDQRDTLSDFQRRYEEQLVVNQQQREEFESQISQLQNNLLGAQAQMTNLSQALQETRELIEPAEPDATDSPADTGALQ